MGNMKVIQCKICGRDIETKVPILILQVIAFMGKHIPIKALFTSMGKCKYCAEMHSVDDTQYDEDTEELTADQFNDLMHRGVPVMKQIVDTPGEDDEEEDEERPSRRKIGFCSDEDS